MDIYGLFSRTGITHNYSVGSTCYYFLFLFTVRSQNYGRRSIAQLRLLDFTMALILGNILHTRYPMNN